MKFIKVNPNNKVCLPIAALDIAKLKDCEKMELNTMENALVVMKGSMNAMEVIHVIEGLRKLSEELIVSLSKVCGKCSECGQCDEFEGYDEIDIPEYLLDEAGIPNGAKLCACTEENSGEITIMQADYDYDLSDVPDEILNTLALAGICIGELEEHLIIGDEVYGQ